MQHNTIIYTHIRAIINLMLDYSHCKWIVFNFSLFPPIFFRFNYFLTVQFHRLFQAQSFRLPIHSLLLECLSYSFPPPYVCPLFYFPTLPLYNFLSTGFVRHLETLAVSNSNVSQQQVLAIALDATWSGPSSRALLLDKYRASCHDRSVLQGALEERRFKDREKWKVFIAF